MSEGIARDGAPKRLDPVRHHPQMTSRQTNTAGIGGLGHAYAGAPDASGPSPTDPTSGASKPFVGKNVPDAHGMKHQGGIPELTRHSMRSRLWREALDRSGPGTRMAHTGSPCSKAELESGVTLNPIK